MEQIEMKKLDQICRALSAVGINVNMNIMYAVVQTQKRIEEKGDQFSIKDAEEIRNDMNAKFPAEPQN